MKMVAQIIPIRRDGTLVLRHHDTVPTGEGIGVVAAFGGAVSIDETPRQAARRLLHDQTNLEPAADDLTFWREYPVGNHQVYVFMAPHVPARGLGVIGARGFALVHNEADTQRLNLTPSLRRVLSDYYHEKRRSE